MFRPSNIKARPGQILFEKRLNVPNHRKSYKSCPKEQEVLSNGS